MSTSVSPPIPGMSLRGYSLNLLGLYLGRPVLDYSWLPAPVVLFFSQQDSLESQVQTLELPEVGSYE